MIHSLSGGVLSKNETYPFVKVEIEGAPYWYLSPTFRVKEGDSVLVPFGNSTVTATVLRVEKCTPQTAPCPMNRIREIKGIL